jgi:hypothetical protein
VVRHADDALLGVVLDQALELLAVRAAVRSSARQAVLEHAADVVALLHLAHAVRQRARRRMGQQALREHDLLQRLVPRLGSGRRRVGRRERRRGACCAGSGAQRLRFHANRLRRSANDPWRRLDRRWPRRGSCNRRRHRYWRRRSQRRRGCSDGPCVGRDHRRRGLLGRRCGRRRRHGPRRQRSAQRARRRRRS